MICENFQNAILNSIELW